MVRGVRVGAAASASLDMPKSVTLALLLAMMSTLLLERSRWMMSLEWRYRQLLKQNHGRYPLEQSRLVTLLSFQACLSSSHQAVPSVALVVWTQDLWSHPGIAQCVGV